MLLMFWKILAAIIEYMFFFFYHQSVLDTGKKLSDDNTIGQEEIQQRLAQFVDHWKELKDLSGAR